MVLKQVSEPLIGDYRVETKFAWWPLWVDNKQIWLEKYQLFYEYKYHFFYDRVLKQKVYGSGWVLIDQKVI